METNDGIQPMPSGTLAAARARMTAVLSFDRREMVALVLLGLLVVAGATVAYARARPASAASLAPLSDVPATHGQEASLPAARIYVHVVGAVARPGVYDLDAGARVVDALRAAGGFTAKANRAGLNLARLLSDGEQVVVPRKGQRPAAGAASGSGGGGDGKVNINTASASELEALPGIGPALSQRIVEHRGANGPFKTVQDLMKVSGIGPKTFARLEPLITI